MLCLSACVSVEDDRFGRDFRDILDGTETGSHIHQLDVRFALCGRIAEARYPHGVELVRAAVPVDHRVLYDETCQAVMGFHCRDKALGLQHFSEPSAPDIGHSELSPGPCLDFLVFLVAGIRELHESSAIGRQHGYYFIADGLLEACTPVVAVHYDSGFIFLEIFFVAERSLVYDLVNAGYVLEHDLALRRGDKGKPLIADYSFIGQDADDQSSEFVRFFDNCNVSAVDDIGGEAHVNCAGLDLFKLGGDHCQIFRIIYLGAEEVLHVQSSDVGCSVQFIQGVLRVDLAVVVLAEFLYLAEPDFPVLFEQLIERLGLHRLVENIDAHLHDLTVDDLGFEILLRQRKCGGNGHAGDFRRHNPVKYLVFEDEIAVHQDNIVVQVLPCAVDRIDVIGLVVDGILHESKVDRQFKAEAVLYQHSVIIAGRDHDLFNACIRDLSELAREDSLTGRDFRHALGTL